MDDWNAPVPDEEIDLDCHESEPGARLRQERIKRGYTEMDLARLLSVGRLRVRAMETGKGAQLNAKQLWKIASIGADVTYILTGQRPVLLAPDESALLDNYRHATPSGQTSLREVGTAFAQQAEALKKTGSETGE
ncbi:helix-turn-helix domain-containing protein [Thauera butanivorans]|uniref:helix-turn-helix domain-containing protein n=1 Tax=Thauera butanivorans TaxID=86174 RepID=UPI0012F84326|nr:helix-turn-helix transcriptional regulator [Thauera butanivorans]